MNKSDSEFAHRRVPWFGVRRFAKTCQQQLRSVMLDLAGKTGQLERLASMSGELVAEVKSLRKQRDDLTRQLRHYGYLEAAQLEALKDELKTEIDQQKKTLENLVRLHAQDLALHRATIENERTEANKDLASVKAEREKAQAALVNTDELAVLQEAGVYRYRHPLTDAVAYQRILEQVESQISAMVKKDGGAVSATTNWTVNNSAAEGRRMVRDFSKLMLRAYNAEADNLVRSMKPHKLESAIDRLAKVSATIERLGKTMDIRIAPEYQKIRNFELELTADFLQKQAEEKEIERLERDRLKEERKAQQEIERERARLEKERQHYQNALAVLTAKGDAAASAELHAQLGEIERAIENVDYRAANIRAGYVYVISNIGSFGSNMIKVGMTRRLDPMDRIRELSDASVPFNFDVHALFFFE